MVYIPRLKRLHVAHCCRLTSLGHYQAVASAEMDNSHLPRACNDTAQVALPPGPRRL